MRSSFTIPFHPLKEASNVLYLDDNGKEIDIDKIEETLKDGYRIGLLLIPETNAIQLQIAMMTPYHKDHYELDPTFIFENYNTYLSSEDEFPLDDQDEFYIGEVYYDAD